MIGCASECVCFYLLCRRVKYVTVTGGSVTTILVRRVNIGKRTLDALQGLEGSRRAAAFDKVAGLRQ